MEYALLELGLTLTLCTIHELILTCTNTSLGINFTLIRVIVSHHNLMAGVMA